MNNSQASVEFRRRRVLSAASPPAGLVAVVKPFHGTLTSMLVWVYQEVSKAVDVIKGRQEFISHQHNPITH